MSDIFKLTSDASQNEAAIAQVIAAIKGGQLAVIPTDTSYALIADAFHPGAVTLLRMAKKQSPEVPIPVATATIEMAHGIAKFSNLAMDLAQAFWPGPLTLLTHSQPSLKWPICDSRTALSIRVPHSEISQQVLTGTGPAAMTGAQVAGQGVIENVERAIEALGEKVAIYLDAGQLPATVSSVIDATTSNLRLVRQGAISLESIRAVNPNVIDAKVKQ